MGYINVPEKAKKPLNSEIAVLKELDASVSSPIHCDRDNAVMIKRPDEAPKNVWRRIGMTPKNGKVVECSHMPDCIDANAEWF